MNTQLVPIAFALTPRMQSFIELRDALRCMSQALHQNNPYAWMPATLDVYHLLVGKDKKKSAIPNIISLFDAMRRHFIALSDKHPEFHDQLLAASAEIEHHAETIRQHVSPAVHFLSSDAWITAYEHAVRKQDLLGHKLTLPQIISLLWHADGQAEHQHASQLHNLLEPMIQGIEHLNQMLHAHVPWEHRVAKEGYDQITLAAQDDIGLIIIGVPQDAIAQGIVPSCSGFRAVLRLRFSQWKPGELERDIDHEQTYAVMAVPVL